MEDAMEKGLIKNRKFAKKYFFGILVILIFSIFLYCPLSYDAQFESSFDEKTNSSLFSVSSPFSQPSFLNFFRKITSPFDLEYYNLYLTMEDTSKSFSDSCEFILTSSTFMLAEENITVSMNTKKKIGTFRINEKYPFGRKYSFSFSSSLNSRRVCKTQIGFKPIYEVNLHFWDFLASVIISFFAYVAFLFLTIKIFKSIFPQDF